MFLVTDLAPNIFLCLHKRPLSCWRPFHSDQTNTIILVVPNILEFEQHLASVLTFPNVGSLPHKYPPLERQKAPTAPNTPTTPTTKCVCVMY